MLYSPYQSFVSSKHPPSRRSESDRARSRWSRASARAAARGHLFAGDAPTIRVKALCRQATAGSAQLQTLLFFGWEQRTSRAPNASPGCGVRRRRRGLLCGLSPGKARLDRRGVA